MKKGLVVTQADKVTREQEELSSLQVSEKMPTPCSLRKDGCVLSHPHSRRSQRACLVCARLAQGMMSYASPDLETATDRHKA